MSPHAELDLPQPSRNFSSMLQAFRWVVASSARSSLALLLCATGLSAQGVGGKIEGVITDSLRGGPLVGALVVATPSSALRDTVFHGVQTDARGRFVFGNLRAGAYALSVEHPVIDSTGIGAPGVAVTVGEAQTASAFLAIPSSTSLRRALCSNIRDPLLGVVTGSVRHAGGRQAAGALVVFSWTDFEVDSATARVLSFQVDSSVHTDANGAYRACGLPIQRSLFVQAQAGPDVQSGILEERIGDAGVLLRDFQVGSVARENAGAGTTDGTSMAPGFSLAGKVTTLKGRPIESAQVVLMGGTRSATTNERGEFRIADISPGTQGVRVIALGYYPQMLRVEPVAGETEVTIKMENAAVVLDSMRIIAKRANTRLRYTGREFEKRASHSPGTFITEEQIASFGAVFTTDVFRHVPGVRLAAPRGPGSEMLTSTRGTADFGATICPMDIFLDGQRIRSEDLSMISPDMMHGIEVHSVATSPVGYKIGKCGAVFIWTK